MTGLIVVPARHGVSSLFPRKCVTGLLVFQRVQNFANRSAGSSRRFCGVKQYAAADPSPTATEKESAVLEAVESLQTAIESSKFDPTVICDAFRKFEGNKMKFEDLDLAIGGGPQGKYWQLQFVANASTVRKDAKASGYRFPLNAVQHFDNGAISNGVYLGHIASLRFNGTYTTKGPGMAFRFEELEIRVGPGRLTFPVGSGSNAEGRFVFFYVDDDFIVARGQSGGTAFWKRLSPSEQLQIGAT